MDELTVELPWPPSVNHYYRHVRNRTIISRDGRKYREVITALLRELHIKPFEGDLEMSVDVYPPDKRRRDLDNLQKSLWDSLQHGGAYKDDCQIKKFTCQMHEPCRPNGKVIIKLKKKDIDE